MHGNDALWTPRRADMPVAFGPVIMFGLGGIFTEFFEVLAFRTAPVGWSAD
ncbi:MAG: acetate--CoA ligase family protein [Pseudomonadota bacterium]